MLLPLSLALLQVVVKFAKLVVKRVLLNYENKIKVSTVVLSKCSKDKTSKKIGIWDINCKEWEASDTNK